MNSFTEILAALGPPPGGPWYVGDDPPLTIHYNAGSESLIAALNEGVHITIYRSSWDGLQSTRDCTGGQVDVGPYCLHTTAGDERWFRQYVQGSWAWVTDCGTPTRRYLLAFDAMMHTLAPYLGLTERAARRRRSRASGGPAQHQNRIDIGVITTTNPPLWVNLFTLGQDPTVYTIATDSPGADFLFVNQFCAILSAQWLLSGRGVIPFGIDDFSDIEKKAMAETLIGFTSMDDQIAYAERQLGGVQRSFDEVVAGVMNGRYEPGTKIWAGNDFHVIGVYLRSKTEYALYDSNTGLTTVFPRSAFGIMMARLRCDAFVVA